MFIHDFQVENYPFLRKLFQRNRKTSGMKWSNLFSVLMPSPNSNLKVRFMKFPHMKYFLTLSLFLSFSYSKSMAQSSSDRKEITQVVQLYFDGMMERDRKKLDQAFLSEARLIGFRGDELTITSYKTWAIGTSRGEPRNPHLHKNELVSIRIQGNAAIAETELYWPGIYYYDFLTLVKVGQSWKIVNKSWSEKKL
jgi:hypothetical protein